MYNRNEKTLTLAKNNDNEIVAFRDVYTEGKDLFPVLRFNGSHSTSKVPTYGTNKFINCHIYVFCRLWWNRSRLTIAPQVVAH